MQNDARRADILTQLSKSQKPVSATALAEKYHLSRQSIVGDIALLRAAGNDIIATSRGYLLATPPKVPFLEKTIACRHNAAAMREELYIAVDEGCTVADVVVDHPRCGASEALPLSFLTSGIHLHTLLCPDEASYERVAKRLRAAGILLSD